MEFLTPDNIKAIGAGGIALLVSIGYFGRFLLAYQAQMTIKVQAAANEDNADADTHRGMTTLATKSSEKAFELMDLLREATNQLGDMRVKFTRIEDDFRALKTETERKDEKLETMAKQISELIDTVDKLKHQLADKERVEHQLIEEKNQAERQWKEERARLLERVNTLEKQVVTLTTELEKLRTETHKELP